MSDPLVAVVGHVEWTTIVRVGRLPTVGEISHTEVVWEGPAGGGAVAAVRVAASTGACAFYTRLGADPEGVLTRRRLADHGVTVVSTATDLPTSRAVSLIDGSGERTTLTIGGRLQPTGDSALPWADLDAYDGVYFTAGDPAALRQARRARLLAATTRELSTVAAGGVAVDLLIGSGCDPAERYRAGLLAGHPALLVRTEGGRGGAYTTARGDHGRYPAAHLPAPPVDTYGVGDNFAASLTVALAAGMGRGEALARAALEAADCVVTRGPYPNPPSGLRPQLSEATGAATR